MFYKSSSFYDNSVYLGNCCGAWASKFPQLKMIGQNSPIVSGDRVQTRTRIYGDLVYRFKKIMGRTDFSDQFRKIIIRQKLIGYDLNVMRQSTCSVINPITVDNFAALFNCTPVDRLSDAMMVPT